MNTETLKIEDFKKYVENAEEVDTLLERGATDILELIGYIDMVQDNIEEADSNLKKLKNVSTIIDLDSTLGNNIKEKVDNLRDNYTKKASDIIAREQLSIELIKAYDEGKDLSKEGNEILKSLTDLGVFWIAKAATEGKSGLYSLSSLLAYKTDEMYDDSIFVVGDGTIKALELGNDLGLEKLLKLDASITSGTIAVGLYSTITNIKRLREEGDWDKEKDKTRLIFEVLSDTAGYYIWSEAASYIAGKIGGTLGGPIGAVAATGATFIATGTINAIKNEVTGDVVVDEFTRNGKNYTVERNGSGEAGTYDVLLKNYKNNNIKKEINGKTYSYSNYKNILYSNWEDIHPNFRKIYGDSKIDSFNKALDQLKNEKNAQKAEIIMEEIKKNYSHSPTSSNDTVGLYNLLNEGEFDLKEYYEHFHPSEERS